MLIKYQVSQQKVGTHTLLIYPDEDLRLVQYNSRHIPRLWPASRVISEALEKEVAHLTKASCLPRAGRQSLELRIRSTWMHTRPLLYEHTRGSGSIET